MKFNQNQNGFIILVLLVFTICLIIPITVADVNNTSLVNNHPGTGYKGQLVSNSNGSGIDTGSKLPPALPKEGVLKQNTNAFQQTVRQMSTLDNPNYYITLADYKWNYISVPKRLLENHRTGLQVFGDINTGGRSIWLFNAVNQNWVSLTANQNVDPLIGMSIYSDGVNQQVPLYFDGTQPEPAEIPVYGQGWNLIGFWGIDQACVRDTLFSIQDIWSSLLIWNVDSQSWDTTVSNSDPSRQKLMYPGKGYWLDTSSNGVLSYHKDKTYSGSAEWVSNYNGHSSNLDYQYDDAWGFYNNLQGDTGNPNIQWNSGFIHGDDLNIDERNWTVNDNSLTGVDSTHFAYFAGHGSPTGLEFGHPRPGTDDYTAAYNEVNWGDKNLDWVALDACNVLNNTQGNNVNNWKQAFHGLHAIYGFATYSNAVDDMGSRFVSNMKSSSPRYTIKGAWFKAFDETQPSYLKAAVAAYHIDGSTQQCKNDYLYGYGPSINPPGDVPPSTLDYEVHPPY